MVRSFSFIIAFLIISIAVEAQFVKKETVKLDHPVSIAAVDRPGDLYVISPQGNIAQYNIDGTLTSKGILPEMPTLFDARDGSRLFTYYRKQNEFIFFSSTFDTQGKVQKIDSAFAIHPYAACASGDHDLIILDSADWSFKKVNTKVNRLLFETPVGIDVSKLKKLVNVREYQNFIFIHDRDSGIHIFNMLGKLLKTIEGGDIEHFSFLGEELYYKKGDALYFLDLFNTETRSIKLPGQAEFALLTDERLYMVRSNTVEIYTIDH